MGFYERQLQLIFENCEGISGQQYTGRTMLARIDRNLRVKASFVTSGFSGQYDAIRVRILNRTEGEVDAQLFYFRDIFNNTPAAKTAYIWDDYGNAQWYNYQPSSRDFERLTEKLGGYIAMYQDEGLEMSSPSM